MTYLLDTCVLSELVSRQPNEKVVAWFKAARPTQMYISALTIGEIKRGVEKLPDDAHRKQTLSEWLEEDLLMRFQGQILVLDVPAMLEWGKLVAGLERQGRKLPALDSFIAAQALYHRHDLVTRNVKDFLDTGVRIFNPWE
jgi:tRNA(fMet)-specific endonuclease VapC